MLDFVPADAVARRPEGRALITPAPEMYQRLGSTALLAMAKTSLRRVPMMLKTRTWAALVVAVLLGMAAPAADASAPGTTIRPPGAGAVKVTCTLVELEWPNGTGTGVWAMVCS